MSKIVIIGAGKTGRGFLADLLKSEEIHFIDRDAGLVSALNSAGEFTVSYFGGKKAPQRISFAGAATWEQTGVIDAELILVAVGGSNLTQVGNQLKSRIHAGQRIIVCENAADPDRKLAAAIGIDGVKIAQSTVFCTTIEACGLDILSEGYPYLQYDAAQFSSGVRPDVLRATENFENFLTRKLYTYNCASCVIAYLGYVKGFSSYADAANDPQISSVLDRNYAAVDHCMCREYGYDAADQSEFSALSRSKFTDRTIADTVSRNARDPLRKLQANERIIAPLLLADKYGEDTGPLCLTAAAALLYRDSTDSAWEEVCRTKTPGQILETVCGLPQGSRLHSEILEKCRFLSDALSNNKEVIL